MHPYRVRVSLIELCQRVCGVNIKKKYIYISRPSRSFIRFINHTYDSILRNRQIYPIIPCAQPTVYTLYRSRYCTCIVHDSIDVCPCASVSSARIPRRYSYGRSRGNIPYERIPLDSFWFRRAYRRSDEMRVTANDR